MRKLHLLLFFFVCTLHVIATAQQEHQYTQFMYNKLAVNPGFAGSRGIPSFTALYRDQWLGFEGRPQSTLIYFDSPMKTSKRVGMGILFNHAKAGLIKNSNLTMSYTYDLIGTENTAVRIGLQGGLCRYFIDFTDKSVVYRDADDDVILQNDRSSRTYWNMGAGVYITHKSFYFGASMPYFRKNTIGVLRKGVAEVAMESIHAYLMAGAILSINDKIDLKPNILAKYVKAAPFDVDLNLNVMFDKKITAGLSYRLGGDGLGDSVDLLLFWQASNQLGIGAAYDFTLSQLGRYNKGSIEVLARYDLNLKGNSLDISRRMTNPRFFF